MTIEELKQEIEEDKKKYGQVVVMSSAFGDKMPGLVKLPIITPPEGGTFIKFYGCSFLFKGNPDTNNIRRLGFAKSMISAIPREIIMRDFFLKNYFIILVLFFKKRLYGFLWKYISILRFHFFNSIIQIIPYERRNVLTKEIQRALEYSLRFNGYDINLDREYDKRGGNLADLVLNFAEFVYQFLENDCSYRFPAQDILPLLNKENLQRSSKKELSRLLDILIDRTIEKTHKRKWIYFKKMVLILMYLPELRQITKDFLLTLDLEKVKMDKDDWYFSLGKIYYNYEDKSLEERLKEKEQIDKECGHILLEFNQKKVEK